jgi:hypothetical protein
MATIDNHGQHDPARFATMDLATVQVQNLATRCAQPVRDPT